MKNIQRSGSPGTNMKDPLQCCSRVDTAVFADLTTFAFILYLYTAWLADFAVSILNLRFYSYISVYENKHHTVKK